MASPIKSNYRTRAVAFVKGEVINAIARVCSHWASGNYVSVHKPENPSADDPIKWDLDVPRAAQAIVGEFDREGYWKGDEADNSTRKDMVGKTTAAIGGKHSGPDINKDEYDTGVEDATTWTRGTDKEKKTVGGEEKQVDAGLKVMLPCRLVTDGIDGYLYFRQFEFDQTGRLVKVGAETDYVSVVSAT